MFLQNVLNMLVGKFITLPRCWVENEFAMINQFGFRSIIWLKKSFCKISVMQLLVVLVNQMRPEQSSHSRELKISMDRVGIVWSWFGLAAGPVINRFCFNSFSVGCDRISFKHLQTHFRLHLPFRNIFAADNCSSNPSIYSSNCTH